MSITVVVIELRDAFNTPVFVAFDPILKESLRTYDKKKAEEWAQARDEAFEWPEE